MLDWLLGIPKGWDQSKFTYDHGPVLSVSVRDILRVSSSTQRCYTSNGDSFDLPVQQFSTSTRQEFWLKTSQGDKTFWAEGQTLPMLQGHEFSVIWYGSSVVAFVNRSTRQGLVVLPNINAIAQRPSKLMHGLFCLFVVYPLAMLPVAIPGQVLMLLAPRLTGNLMLLWAFTIIIGCVVYYFKRRSLYVARLRTLNRWANEKIREVLQS